MAIYQRLYDAFGPRRWWPAETAFEVMVGAVLTQNVAWRNVERAIASLKGTGLMDPMSLYQADQVHIERLIVPTRYYKTKARKLKALVTLVVERYGGDLNRMFSRPLGELRQELLGVYGIGPETADAILLYAGNLPIFVVDAYTRRIFHRLGVFPPDISYGAMQEYFQVHLPRDVALYNEYHALIDGLGHRLCLATRPRCGECPLVDECRYPGEEAVVNGSG
ncbi:endonuclease [Clostridiales bacterium PH28_bin88]|nr:endonuclease [Clostridiales bacterium PH28_bin88]